MTLWILLKQDFKNLITNPITFVFCFLYPPVLIFLFGFLFSYSYGNGGITSYDFYGITMMFYMILGTITITPNAFMEKRIKQANLRIAYSPVSRVVIYMSKILSSFFFMGIMFTIDMCILQYFNIVNYGHGQFLKVLGVMYSMLAFSVSLGGAVCVILHSEELTNKLLTIVATAMAVFSGVFFQIDGFGDWAENMSKVSVLKWGIDCVFEIIYDGSCSFYAPLIVTLILAAIICIILIHFFYKPEDYI